MKKYLITTVNPQSGEFLTLERDDYNINHCIDTVLGGWKNLCAASHGDRNLDDENYQMAGTNKEGIMFSIICYKTKE